MAARHRGPALDPNFFKVPFFSYNTTENVPCLDTHNALRQVPVYNAVQREEKHGRHNNCHYYAIVYLQNATLKDSY